ncbi:hypothetical protein BaRGS_00021563 [Batillaria attramentaria]|uniref:Ig-like domain-containing protein n=1 Tax=Batillaria attramentaria TaxID=370345 RepID=A0ABD0KIZ7_9CAEN
MANALRDAQTVMSQSDTIMAKVDKLEKDYEDLQAELKKIMQDGEKNVVELLSVLVSFIVAVAIMILIMLVYVYQNDGVIQTKARTMQVLGILFVLLTKTLPAKGVTTCDAPPVREGEAAAVTCTFSEDVRQANRNIKVQRYPPDSKGFDPDTVVNVLDCHWLDAGQINCDTNEDYELTGEVGKQTVITIPRASRQNVGRYMCEVVPSEPDDIKPCYFFLKEQLDSENIFAMLSRISEQVSKLGNAVEDGRMMTTGLIVVVVILILLILAAVLLFVFQKRVRELLQRRAPPAKTNEKGIEMTEKGLSSADENTENKDGSNPQPRSDEDYIRSVLTALSETNELSTLLGIANARKEPPRQNVLDMNPASVSPPSGVEKEEAHNRGGLQVAASPEGAKAEARVTETGHPAAADDYDESEVMLTETGQPAESADVTKTKRKKSKNPLKRMGFGKSKKEKAERQDKRV